MQIRLNYKMPPMLSLSSSQLTANGSGITLGGTAGTIAISITPADTQTLGNGLYDLEIEFTDGSIQTPVAGTVVVNQEITVWPTA